MPSYFCISVRFLQRLSHGRGERGNPEWPPSPLRVFQALVAAAAARWNERMRLEYAATALHWLERQPVPIIVAAVGTTSGVKYRLYVPDNTADKVAASWSRGGAASIADYRTEKDVRPTHLDGEAVHYLYPLADADSEFAKHRETLSAAARSITHLGWGVDMVAANATIVSAEESAKLQGERWRPVQDTSADGYRVPIKGTLQALMEKHEAFLNRVGADGFKPVSPLSAFHVVGYRRDTDPVASRFAAFQLLTIDAGGMRPFNPRRPAVVAGMVRHVVAEAARAAGRPEAWINESVLGHGTDGPAKTGPGVFRLSYLPLPSIEHWGGKDTVGTIRRVLVAECMDGTGELASWLRRAVSGRELTNLEDEPVALLSVIPDSDRMIRRYVPKKGSSVWSTVTPVILPGHDDHDADKAEGLLRKAIEQSGFSASLATHAELEWRHVGFLPGLDLASRYEPPEYLKRFSRHHVRIIWRDAGGRPVSVQGPVVIGAGRYCGFGLFVASQ